MQTFSTPMMQQYAELKSQYQDCLLFFRLGDFYELFLDDAHIGAKILDITLTSRPEGRDGKVPMAGVPYHAVDAYLSKLVKAGYKVAICEQVELPDKYGIVKRDVVRIVTPGTVLDEKSLNNKENNYIISLKINSTHLGITIADLSTGELSTNQIKYDNLDQTLNDLLIKIKPVECLLNQDNYLNLNILKTLSNHKNLNIYCYYDWEDHAINSKAHLTKHFKVKTLHGFGIDDKELAIETACILLKYLKETQKDNIKHFNKISYQDPDNILSLDRSTIINLELFSTIRDQETKGSLISVLDQTQTAMGARMLRNWVTFPLINQIEIQARLDCVEELNHKSSIKQQISLFLTQISDVERIVSRLSLKLCNARDLVNLKNTLINIIEVKSILSKLESELIKDISNQIDTSLKDLINLIEKNIMEEPPIDIRIGKMIKPDLHPELDELRMITSNGKAWIEKLEKEERERTGINSLKIKFNKVFGFFIEVSNSNLQNIPISYQRKQTLVNNERFITPELKKKEEQILLAEETIQELEYKYFMEILEQTTNYLDPIQRASKSIATLDCLVNFSNISQKNNYCKPKLTLDGKLEIKKGRHPVVEQLLEDTSFVPNDINLDNNETQLMLITGPNMAGKSVYIRQTALIVLMAQIGSFVPATSATISIVDKIFVRSGASDVITSNLSTFMVEMVETAHILNHATKNSLIIMDEIGRGTSTFDGISIAWATAEYLVTNPAIAAKTLFATHYHELQDLENHFPSQIKNYHLAVENNQTEPIFLHTIMPGAAEHSYGVAVAKLAGVPPTVIEKANQILSSLESRELQFNSNIKNQTAPIPQSEPLIQEISKIDIHNITPLQALNKLAELKNKV